MLGTDHADPADLGFTDLQVDDAVFNLLLRQLDVHRLVTLGLVAFLQGLTGPFDIAQFFLRTEERVHRLFDSAGIEHGIAAHEVLVDVYQPRRSLGLGALLFGVYRRRQCPQCQPAQRQR